MDNNVSATWDRLEDEGIATCDELKLITDINGYDMKTLNDVLYARTGYRDFEQMDGEA
jgi:hypothetical protein